MGKLTRLIDALWEPRIIAAVLEIPESEVQDAIEARANALKQIEAEYRELEAPKVQAELKAFKEEFPQSVRDDMRRRYLLQQLQELKKNPDDPRLKKVMMEIKIFTGKAEGITPEMLARARAHPITDLIKTTRGMAHCPFHVDKSPSMDVRKNFFHCYSCQASGDTIDLLMKRDGLTFKQAVHKLVAL